MISSTMPGLYEELFGPPGTTPDPPPPPVPPLGVALAGVRAGNVARLPFVPGLVTPDHHGLDPMANHATPGLTVQFTTNAPSVQTVGAPSLQAALDATRQRLAAVRDGFKAHPLYAAWKNVTARLTAEQDRAKQLQLAPASALGRARKLLIMGQDPTPAEQEHDQAERDLAHHKTRLDVLRGAEDQARRNAAAELARLVAAELAAVHAEATARAREAAAVLEAAANQVLDALVTGNALAGMTSSHPRVREWWGNAISDRYAELP